MGFFDNVIYISDIMLEVNGYYVRYSASSVPSCAAIYYMLLYCTVLYCTVLYCTVLYCTVLYCTVLYCTVLFLSDLYRIVSLSYLTIFNACVCHCDVCVTLYSARCVVLYVDFVLEAFSQSFCICVEG